MEDEQGQAFEERRLMDQEAELRRWPDREDGPWPGQAEEAARRVPWDDDDDEQLPELELVDALEEEEALEEHGPRRAGGGGPAARVAPLPPWLQPSAGTSGGASTTPMLAFSDDEDEELDTTAEQVMAGRDMQGIPWDRLQFTREHYRTTRLKQYRNYVNVLPDNPEEYRPQLLAKCMQPQYGSSFYAFDHNSRAVTTTIVHFQLRNLLWATSRNDVFCVCSNSINHWNPATRRITEVINLSGGGRKCARAPAVGKVQVSTLCVRGGLIATGGFGGELVVKRLGDEGWVYTGRISHSENGITNGLEVFDSPSGAASIMASNNDSLVRVFDLGPSFRCVSQWEFPWAVNYAAVQPSGGLAAVVGDDPITCLVDVRTGATVSRLAGHDDFSFAAAWHPNSQLLATGNQDTTTAVWDLRQLNAPLVRLAGRMGAIRSLRWSPDGRYLAACEPADFVHLYDAGQGFRHAQEIDLFGEISGMSFTPAGDALFVGIADITYASLLTFSRARPGAQFLPHPHDLATPPPYPLSLNLSAYDDTA